MYNIYKVKSGDTLESIASYLGVNADRLAELNGLDNKSLSIDDTIIVPNGVQDYFDYYTIKKGDTLYAIARRYNINPELLTSLNGLEAEDYIYPNQTILIPKSEYSYYITKTGDTLDSVSDTFGVSRDELLDENDVIYLMEGQMLVNRAR